MADRRHNPQHCDRVDKSIRVGWLAQVPVGAKLPHLGSVRRFRAEQCCSISVLGADGRHLWAVTRKDVYEDKGDTARRQSGKPGSGGAAKLGESRPSSIGLLAGMAPLSEEEAESVQLSVGDCSCEDLTGSMNNQR